LDGFLKEDRKSFQPCTKWKNTVFDKLDEVIIEDISTNVPKDSTLVRWLGLQTNRSIGKPDMDSENIILHSKDSDNEMEHPTLGRLSKVYT
jgi:hypothetical protein